MFEQNERLSYQHSFIYDLSEDEKCEMVQCLAKGLKTTNILKKLNSDNRTVKRFVNDLEHRRTRSEKGLLREVSVEQINCI